MGYNKITLYGEQMCDYMYVQSSPIPDGEFEYVNSEPKNWQKDTLLFSKFNNNLVAGDSSLTDKIVGYEVRRKRGNDFHTEYVGTITEASGDSGKYMIDYAVLNNSKYTYYLYPSSSYSGSGILLSPSKTNEIETDWHYWSLLVVDETDKDGVFYLNKMFKFEYNLSTDDMSNNAVVSVVQNFTKYPTVQYSPANYWSGGLQSLCGFISCNDVDYIQTPNMIEELKSLTVDTRRKFLKDMDGNLFEVKISAPISISTDDNTLQRIKSVKISWIEVGDATGVSITNNPNIPATSWLLTETGEVVPYNNYIWDDRYIWDDSYIWTAKDDILDTNISNLGRDLYSKEGDNNGNVE